MVIMMAMVVVVDVDFHCIFLKERNFAFLALHSKHLKADDWIQHMNHMNCRHDL